MKPDSKPGTRPIIQPTKRPGTDLHGSSTTTQRTTTTTEPITTTSVIPTVNKTEAELKEEFPWIENPETSKFHNRANFEELCMCTVLPADPGKLQ